MVAQNISFGIIALAMAVGAVRVVTARNVVHAALWLVIVLAGAAGQFILLAAEFVAVTQVLVYIGAIVVLFLFGTMLTRAQIGREDQLTADVSDSIFSTYLVPFEVVSVLLLAALVGAIVLARKE